MTLIKTEYCPNCDAVWASPGKCKCELVTSQEITHYEIAIWNAAIEAAADKANKRGLIGMRELGVEIRKLKK